MGPPGHRAVAFSAKAKKKQLQNKREVNRHKGSIGEGDEASGTNRQNMLPFLSGKQTNLLQTENINQQPSKGSQTNRFNLKFHADTKEEIEARKAQARLPFKQEPVTSLEIGCDMVYVPGLEFPKRPEWDYSLSQELLDMKENRYFREYVDSINKSFSLSELSYFEMNLETWRQLWRVLEMSDIILVIVDARFPSLLFPPSLHHYVTRILKKHLILVINKVDLVPPPVLAAWKHYFEKEFPETKVVLTSSLSPTHGKGKFHGKTKPHSYTPSPMSTEAALNILKACDIFTEGKVDLSSWQMKILEEAKLEDVNLLPKKSEKDVSHSGGAGSESSILTIGCVGQPNVGKSSLINALMGKKVVSVSKTPGHTKHFQTIFITPNVKLCDCPGLVFPSKLPRTWQVLTGSYPVAHLREPYTAVGFLAKHLDLPNSLKLKYPQDTDDNAEESNNEWSAYDICEAWAIKRGFMTKRAARPDVARAANNLLRLSLEGKICLFLYPPNYHNEATSWESNDITKEIVELQLRSEPEADDWSSVSSQTSADPESDESESSSKEDDNPAAGSLNKFALLTDDKNMSIND